VTEVTRAAGSPLNSTVFDPIAITSAPQPSEILAAGRLFIRMFGEHGGITGAGTPEVAGLTIRSVILAAGNILIV